METQEALQQLGRVEKTYRAAEKIQEVLKTAQIAEGRQAELEKEIEVLAASKTAAQTETQAVVAALEEAKTEHARHIDELQTDHSRQIVSCQEAEDEAKAAVVNAQTMFKSQVEELQNDFDKKKEKLEVTLQNLNEKVEEAKHLLEDTRNKFREIV